MNLTLEQRVAWHREIRDAIKDEKQCRLDAQQDHGELQWMAERRLRRAEEWLQMVLQQPGGIW